MNTNNVDDLYASVDGLVSLGFSEIEALIYSFLVGNSPATAYRVAQCIGKPVANTYKAVETLRQKGAILIDETSNRLCRAVNPDELLKNIERKFFDSKEQVANALSRLEPAISDVGIYKLTTLEQILERTRLMLERSREVALLDVFPLLLSELRSDIEKAAGRGVKVVICVYEPVNLSGVTTILDSQAAELLERWSGQWLAIVVDGAEYLFAYLSEDGKRIEQAVWSQSNLLSWVHHSYLASTLLKLQLEELINRNAPSRELKKCLSQFKDWSMRGAFGYHSLEKK